MKYSQWYPIKVKPVRDGAYQVRLYSDGELRWTRVFRDGLWHYIGGVRSHTESCPSAQWRGLAAKS